MASGWYPSGARRPTRRARLIFPGTRTRIQSASGARGVATSARLSDAPQPGSRWPTPPGQLSASRAKSARPAPRRGPGGRRPRAPAPRGRRGRPDRPASADRSILRRWAKAASTRRTPAGGWPSWAAAGADRRPAPSRRWAPARTPSAAPYRPGGPRSTRPASPRAPRTSSSPGGAQPVGHLGLHHHQPVRHRGKPASTCSSTGTLTLYGRFATTAVGCERAARRPAARRPRGRSEPSLWTGCVRRLWLPARRPAARRSPPRPPGRRPPAARG